MRVLMVGILFAATTSAVAQQPGEDVFPKVVKGTEYRLKYGQHPDEGWQDGMQADSTKEECQKRLDRLKDLPGPRVCMVRPQQTAL